MVHTRTAAYRATVQPTSRHFHSSSVLTMWLASLAVLAAVSAWRLWAQGPRHALGCIAVLSLLVPKWVMQEIGGFPIDVRVAAAVLGLVAYCLHRRATIRTPLVWIDFLLLALVAAHLISDWHNDGFGWSVPLRAYGEWVLPYLAGRLALQSLEDVRRLMPFATVVAVVLGACATVEMLSGTNLPELLYGPRPWEEGAPRDLSRWGLKRAYGPTMNPIYFGALQLLLFPWAMYAAARRAGTSWWRVSPWICAAGIFATVSRAPQGALVALLFVMTMLLAPRWRWALSAVAATIVIAAATQRELVLDALHLWGGDKRPHERTIVLDGEEVPYTNALHRAYLFRVYGTAMRRAGPFGFGTEAVTGFPINVPVGPQEVKTLDRLWCIDNAYILLWLRFGYVGVACFILLSAVAVATYALMALSPFAQGSVFYAGMAGALAGTLLLLLTVWMPHDFGFWYLWSLGAAAGLTAHRAWRAPVGRDHPRPA